MEKCGHGASESNAANAGFAINAAALGRCGTAGGTRDRLGIKRGEFGVERDPINTRDVDILLVCVRLELLDDDGSDVGGDVVCAKLNCDCLEWDWTWLSLDVSFFTDSVVLSSDKHDREPNICDKRFVGLSSDISFAGRCTIALLKRINTLLLLTHKQ